MMKWIIATQKIMRRKKIIGHKTVVDKKEGSVLKLFAVGIGGERNE
jgi:hypothetical protein